MRKNVILSCLLTVLIVCLTCGSFKAEPDNQAKNDLYRQGIATSYRIGGEEQCYDYIAGFRGSIPADIIQIYVDRGYLNNHIDDLKALGYTNVDYSAVTGSSNAATPTQTQPAEPAKTPDPFTVETYNPAKTMWATQIVNCREGASIEYNKIGSLTEDEEVSVTGIASTGWYQITREDGTIVYVSEKYLTEKEPTKEEIVTEMVSEAAEESQIKEEEAIPEPTLEPTPEQTATPEPTIEPTMEPTQEPTAESVVEPTVNDTTVKRNFSTLYMVVGLVVAIVIGIGAVIIVKKKRK
ncbi:MAG: SH3 domain-containing protein [Lachnospiraceae bacterium]|nr:SH3 domain-containing protein [Lachnospiraceae bacterium]MDD7629001.1 SH3 domain-containing protein [Lachnospiraceae bacterium]MDY4117675.1 SH3 domain-containing protein [Lachnospiraceae bacterium]